MRQRFAGISALSVLLLIPPPGASQAQTAPEAVRAAVSLNYDLSQEVTLQGTVADVLTNPFAGMLAGFHLLLTTVAGPADVSLGAFALQGKGGLSIAGGQQVEVIGVMKAFKGKQVCLARVVKVDDHVYVIRNEHGVPVTPLARERANQNVQNGETR